MNCMLAWESILQLLSICIPLTLGNTKRVSAISNHAESISELYMPVQTLSPLKSTRAWVKRRGGMRICTLTKSLGDMNAYWILRCTTLEHRLVPDSSLTCQCAKPHWDSGKPVPLRGVTGEANSRLPKRASSWLLTSLEHASCSWDPWFLCL